MTSRKAALNCPHNALVPFARLACFPQRCCGPLLFCSIFYPLQRFAPWLSQPCLSSGLPFSEIVQSLSSDLLVFLRRKSSLRHRRRRCRAVGSFSDALLCARVCHMFFSLWSGSLLYFQCRVAPFSQFFQFLLERHACGIALVPFERFTPSSNAVIRLERFALLSPIR